VPLSKVLNLSEFLCLFIYKKRKIVGRQWLMPSILATQEAEIRKIEVQSQAKKTVCETLSGKKPIIQKKDWWSGSRCKS
jgi:hypothetical protein